MWAIKLYTIQISCLCPSTSRMTSKLGVVQFFLYNLYFHTDSNWIKNEAMGRHPEEVMWFLNSSHCLAQKQIRANMSILYLRTSSPLGQNQSTFSHEFEALCIFSPLLKKFSLMKLRSYIDICVGRGGNPRSFEKPPQVAVSQNIILKSGVVRAVSFFKDSIFWPD